MTTAKNWSRLREIEKARLRQRQNPVIDLVIIKVRFGRIASFRPRKKLPRLISLYVSYALTLTEISSSGPVTAGPRRGLSPWNLVVCRTLLGKFTFLPENPRRYGEIFELKKMKTMRIGHSRERVAASSSAPFFTSVTDCIPGLRRWDSCGNGRSSPPTLPPPTFLSYSRPERKLDDFGQDL